MTATLNMANVKTSQVRIAVRGLVAVFRSTCFGIDVNMLAVALARDTREAKVSAMTASP
jgi:hypothetical protein